MISINEKSCVGCGICVAYCPEDALKVWGLAELIPDKCTECLICIDYCPIEALEVTA
ncbi:MAG: 4Fe-4S binding protein [Dehalococcoidia bacterium]